MSTSSDPEYAQAVKDFEALRALLPGFRAAGVIMRQAHDLSPRITKYAPPGMRITRGAQRDFAVCALANEGCNTHLSVRAVADSGDGDSAMALSRIVMETALLLKWMLLDSPFRLDLYCLSSALFKRRWTQLVAEYFSGTDVEKIAASKFNKEEAAVVQAAFGNAEYNWARERGADGRFRSHSFNDMVEEIVEKDATTTKNFQYDVTYFMHSSHTHSTADGMRLFTTLGGQKFFTCELGFNEGHRGLALHFANLYLCVLLSSVCGYLGLTDLDAELDAWFEAMRKAQRGAAP